MEDAASSQATLRLQELYSQLSATDDELQNLQRQRAALKEKISSAETQQAMRARAKMLAGMVEAIKSEIDPVHALLLANCRLLPWRHNLPRLHFGQTLEALPESLPSYWNPKDARSFFDSVAVALQNDMASLEEH
jgi:multidrug efflux pump subunit AcrA (membrane-fusion protein)